MARFYSNENFPQLAVKELRRLGHDILTVLEAGRANQSIPDEEVLAFAKSHNRAILTLNRKHFIRLHQLSPDHAGIIVCTFDPDFLGQAQRIDNAIKELNSLQGQLLRINRGNFVHEINHDS